MSSEMTERKGDVEIVVRHNQTIPAIDNWGCSMIALYSEGRKNTADDPSQVKSLVICGEYADKLFHNNKNL